MAAHGECPRWSRDGQRVFWIDIPAGTLHRTAAPVGGTSAETHSWKMGREIAALVIDAQSGLWAWVDGSIRCFDDDGQPIAQLDKIFDLNSATTRANDAAWAPDGSLWISTMARDGTSELGSVVRYSPSAGVTTVVAGLPIGNGPVFDAQRGLAYVADSVRRRVLRLRLADPTEPEAFVTLGVQEGYPDGMAVDHAGNLWMAHYGAARISVWSSRGVRIRTIATPCACPTAIDLNDGVAGIRAAVTSAAFGTESGGLWCLTMPAVG